jgi:PAS domain S-box-containing protein
MGAYRVLAEAIDEAVFITEPGGRVLYANSALQRLTGYTSEDLQRGERDNLLLHRDDSERVAVFIRRFFDSGAAVSEPIENRFVDRWGQTQWCRSVLGRVQFDGIDAVQFVTRQIERDDGTLPSLDLLRDYRLLVQNAGDGITKLDSRGRLLFYSARFREIVGRDAVALGHSWISDLLHPDCRADLGRFLVPGRFETQLVNGAGDPVCVEVVVASLAPGSETMALIRDVTEQRRLQRELHTREKLEGLGLLAGGVAHDLNNFLAVVQTNGALAEVAEREGLEVKTFLQEIRHACGKAANLCTRLLAAAGHSPTMRTRVELGVMVEDMVSLLRPNVPQAISIVWRTESDRFVSGDVGALQPLVMNLITNAAEAIGQGPGRIEIEVGAVEHAGDNLGRLEPGGVLPRGRVAYIRVADDGIGMDASTRVRMFDPFFTTKSAGYGLGLSSVLGTVRAHAGAIRVETAKGVGTTMTIYLPLADDEADVADVASEGRSPSPAGNRVVLIADDEPSLRRSLTLILSTAGFETIEARDGAQAVELVRARADISAVLLDASMPVMGGVEAARIISALRSGLPIVMMSGKDHETVAGAESVTKPFEPERLLELLDRMTAPS